MVPTLADGSRGALDKALDRLRISLLAAAAARQSAASEQRDAHQRVGRTDPCHTMGGSTRVPHPRGTGTAA